MRKLFLTLYFKMFITMLLLAAIAVLAFYLQNARQKQLYLQQHSQFLITQIQAYFDDKEINISDSEQLSSELIILQQFSDIHLTQQYSSKNHKINVNPNLQIDAVFPILNNSYQLHWLYHFNQKKWMEQLASLLRARAINKSLNKIEGLNIFDGFLAAMEVKTQAFDSQKYSDHELKLLLSDLPIVEYSHDIKNIISVHLLLDEQTLISVYSPIYKTTQSLEVLLYTLGMLMFFGLFICILYIRPIENKIAGLLKNLDKQTKQPEKQSNALPIESSIQTPKDEIDLINLKVSQMMQRMRQLANDQQEMTRAVSHEFRTPIVKMGYHVELLQDFVAEDDFSIVGIKQNMKELHELVDELLLYSNLEHDLELEYEYFNLENAINKLINELQAINKCNISLVMPEEISIKAHENYLIRALQNLITNAQRYAKKDIVIIVEQINRQVQIRVEDDGIGLTKEQKNTVFEPFKVVEESRNKKLAGHGLGLAIVKRIVLLHGGKAFVDDPVQLTGASFVLMFPMRAL